MKVNRIDLQKFEIVFSREWSKGVIFKFLVIYLENWARERMPHFIFFFRAFLTIFWGKMILKNLKFEKIKISFFSKSTRMICIEFQVPCSKTMIGSFRTDEPTDRQTDRHTYMQRTVTGETLSKPKLLAGLCTGR